MKKTVFIILALSLVLFASLFFSCNVQKGMKEKTNIQLAKSFISENTGDTINYWFYLPVDYYKKEKSPLLLFLHGAGERGDSLGLVKKQEVK